MKGVRAAELAPFLLRFSLPDRDLPLFRIDFRFAYVILPHEFDNRASFPYTETCCLNSRGFRPCREADVKIQVRKGNLTEAATEAAVVTHFEGEAGLGGAAAKLDEKSGGLISEIIGQGDFTGRLHQVSASSIPGGVSRQSGWSSWAWGRGWIFLLRGCGGPFPRPRSRSDP